MRLLALDLLRYGHLTDIRLRFPEEAGLHVVLGANEAGKSTALAAIGDALFGFPHLTRYAFRHETSQLRIGFEVAARDGSRGAFIRVKRRQNALLDAADAPVPEASLQRKLGGAGRELFEKGFGLDAGRLRDGAKSLIEGGGAAGEGILAGMGLPHLRRALERIEKAADDLHGTRHRLRKLAQAHDSWQAAQRNLDAAAVKPAEWTAAGDALDRVRQDLARTAAEADSLTREALRLRRARTVRHPLAELATLRAELAGAAEAPPLPADAADRVERLATALDKAEADEAREREAADLLEAELASLGRDPAMLAFQDRVDALQTPVAAALAAERDVPKLRREASDARRRVAEAAGRLGLDASPETARDAQPQEKHRRAAQRLIRERTAALTRVQGAEEALRTAERRHAAARKALAEAPAPAPSPPFRHAIETARAEGPLDRDLADADRALAEAGRRAATALAALDLWSGNAAALAACRLPLPAACDDAARRLDAAGTARDASRRAQAELTAEIGSLDADLAHLARGETVPTREVVAAARAERDAAWRALRDALASGTAPAQPDAFESLRDAADRLADARADDAGRVNDYAAKSARLASLRARSAETAAAVAGAAGEVAAAETAWRALWAPSAVVPLSPPAMREWRAERQKVLDLDGQAAELGRRRDALAARRDAAHALLAAHLTAPHEPKLAPLLARAETACAALEAAEATHRTRRDAAAKAEEAEAEARAARDAAATDLAADAETSRAALGALGLPGTADMEEVEAALAAWTSIAEASNAWRAAEARIAGMEAALATLARDTATIAEALGEAVRDEPPAATAARLARRLDEARQAEIRADGLAQQIASRREAAGAADEAHRAAIADLARLHALAGTDALPALRAAVERAAARTRLLDAIVREEAKLRESGDGLPEATLRTEIEGFDPDAATARVQEIELRQAELNEQRTRLGAERQRAESAIAALEAGRDAAAHAQDACHALVEAQAAAERYARLHLARTLLKAGIERLREGQQGPMLRSATAHFALLTGGRYVRLTTAEADNGAPVLRALRDDGTACPMDGLSEGARDQLFLALRVAALELQAEEAEPLPFIADDLLASFDEDRAGAALRLLARLGERVQVILFTHHAHVADMASGMPGAAVLRLPAALPAA